MGLFGRKKDGGPVLREMVANLHWDLEDPFIFASHHFDLYPKGNERQAPPKEEIEKKDLGNDYHGLFGYRLYTSKLTPGFQLHSHWGYETVTSTAWGTREGTVTGTCSGSPPEGFTATARCTRWHTRTGRTRSWSPRS